MDLGQREVEAGSSRGGRDEYLERGNFPLQIL